LLITVLEAPPVSSLLAAKENNSLQIDLLEISQVVDQKIKDHLHDETLPKVEKKKRNQYGLTPGSTPFPEHIGPIAKECEEASITLLKMLSLLSFMRLTRDLSGKSIAL